MLLATLLALGLLTPPQTTFQLVAIHVDGAQRYTERDIAQMAGLSIHQSLTTAELDAAARRVAATGLFTGVKYQFSTKETALTVNFEVEEAPLAVPVAFDNFVWMTEADLTSAVRAAVPGFDGKGPDNDIFVTYLTGVLQKVLDARAIRGRVTFSLATNVTTRARALVFVVSGAPGLTICRVDLPGASAVPAATILASGDPIVGREYSRTLVRDLSRGTWLDTYHHEGHWKAALADPVATPDATCGGVAVTVGVNEGPSYTWAAASWPGASALTAHDLDTLLGMTAGRVADGGKLDAGLRRVIEAYRKRGYLDARTDPTPQLDDASGQVSFQIAVTEGRQFQMGTLTFTGLPDKIVTELTKKWKLHSGDIYDASYPSTFVSGEIAPLRRREIIPADIAVTERRQDDGRPFVDVTIGPR